MAQASVAQVVVPLSPLTATGSVGTVTQGLSIALSGVAAAGAVGSVGLGPRSFALTGNYAKGDVGVVIAVYWKLIDDMQVADWQNIGNNQTPGWSGITNDETPNWVLIPTE
jgi:hypothetical protein